MSSPTQHDVKADRGPLKKQDARRGVASGTIPGHLARTLLIPASILVLVMCFFPLIYFFQYSFTPSSIRGIASIEEYTLAHYWDIARSSRMRTTIARSVIVAVFATTLGVVLAIPVARWISVMKPRWRTLALIVTVFPLFVGDVIRAIGWAAAVGYTGFVSRALKAFGLIEEGANVQHNVVTLVIAMASSILPIIILILEATFEGINPNVERASHSLGVAPGKTFLKVVLPQAVPGIVAASALIFVMSVNTFSVPLLIGGNQVPMVAPLIYDTVTLDSDWQLASALSVTVITISVVATALFTWFMRKQFERWREAT